MCALSHAHKRFPGCDSIGWESPLKPARPPLGQFGRFHPTLLAAHHGLIYGSLFVAASRLVHRASCSLEKSTCTPGSRVITTLSTIAYARPSSKLFTICTDICVFMYLSSLVRGADKGSWGFRADGCSCSQEYRVLLQELRSEGMKTLISRFPLGTLNGACQTKMPRLDKEFHRLFSWGGVEG